MSTGAEPTKTKSPIEQQLDLLNAVIEMTAGLVAQTKDEMCVVLGQPAPPPDGIAQSKHDNPTSDANAGSSPLTYSLSDMRTKLTSVNEVLCDILRQVEL